MSNTKIIYSLYFSLVLIILTLVGLAGYYFGFLGFIYNVMMPGALGNFPLLVLSVIFGAAAFFSPCSFSVLPAYVSHFIAGGEAPAVPEVAGRARDIVRGLRFGLVAAAGVLTINLIVGVVIALLGAAAPFAKDPRQDIPLILAVRAVAGLVIAYLGVMTFLDKPLAVPAFAQRLIGRVDFRKSIFLYGLLYNGAAIGCTGPILLGLTLYAFTTGSFAGALTAFVVFALTMGVLMILLTTLTAVFKGSAARRLVPFAPVIKKTAGAVMFLTGLAITLLTLQGNVLFVKIFFPFLK